MAGRLHQLLAVVKGEKPRLYEELSNLYKAAQKAALYEGFTKKFVPNNEEDAAPDEHKLVQLTTHEVLLAETRHTTKLLDLLGRVEWTDSVAKADIKIDDQVILANVPATFLLALEKRINDIQTLVKHLPELDSAEKWTYDENSGLHVTEPTKVVRTKKVQVPLVLLQPTEHHPGQAQLISKDVKSGTLETVKQSGAISKPEKEALLDRVEKLLNAVKIAREQANATEEIHTPNIGEAIFGYLNFRAAVRR